MRISRRTVAAVAGAVLGLPGRGQAQGQTQGEQWPSRTVRIIVPRAPGGGSDNLARVLAGPLSQRLGQTVVVDNRPDATAILGAEQVVRAAPDGYTLLLSDNALYQNPSFIPHIPFDTLRDLSAVTMLAEAAVLLLANKDLPVTDVPSLLAYGRANPGRLSFASGGVGASTHFAGVLFSQATGVELLHVPFRSSGPAVTALLSGQVQLQFGGPSSGRALVEAGTARPLAVTGAQRDPVLPQVPTFAEQGVQGVEVTSVWGLHAPAATPLALRQRIQQAVAATMTEPAVAERLRGLGYVPIGNTPEAHQAQTVALVNQWIELAKRVRLDQ